MKALELKIPPPLVAVIFATLIWLTAKNLPQLVLSLNIRYTILIAALLMMICIETSSLMAFKQNQTTINPIKPEKTSSLVTSGIYQWTRNPMYLGLTIILIGWSLFLSSIYALVLVIGFVLYISRFQIQPEERALEKTFGEHYLDYKQKARRWL